MVKINKKIKIGDFRFTEKHKKVIDKILKSGQITESTFVKKLERRMEKFLGVRNAILVTNGTVALQLVAHYLMYKKGKFLNVAVPALTFPATINSFLILHNYCLRCYVGEDLHIDNYKIPAAHTIKTDIVVPVHLIGYPANIDKIMSQAKKYGWVVVEDCAEAFGAEYKGKKVGTFGNFSCFSFYISHNISAGELGMVVTDDDSAAKVLRSMKNHGRVGDNLKFEHSFIGSNYKTTEFSAGICYSEMSLVKKILSTRLGNARYFFDNINNPKLKQFHCPDGFSPLGYPIEAESESYRDKICKKLNRCGIETRYIFPNLIRQKAYEGAYFDQFPVAERLAKTVFYIPSHHLLTGKNRRKIVKKLNENI